MTYIANSDLPQAEPAGLRRRRFALLVLFGVASSVAVLVIAIAARSPVAPPETRVETLPGPDLYQRATVNTEHDSHYVADATFASKSLQTKTHVVVLGSRVLGISVHNGADNSYRFEDGRYYSKSGDGWTESILPAGREYDLLETIKKIWPALRAGDVQELQRDQNVAVYRGTCAPGSVVGRMHWLCDRGSLIKITVDVATERIKELDATGSMPLWPGQWEQGQLLVTFDSASGAEIAPIEKIDISKVECLARTLGIPLDRAAVAERLRDTTTAQNSKLFSGCGYQWFPPGADYGVT